MEGNSGRPPLAPPSLPSPTSPLNGGGSSIETTNSDALFNNTTNIPPNVSFPEVNLMGGRPRPPIGGGYAGLTPEMMQQAQMQMLQQWRAQMQLQNSHLLQYQAGRGNAGPLLANTQPLGATFRPSGATTTNSVGGNLFAGRPMNMTIGKGSSITRPMPMPTMTRANVTQPPSGGGTPLFRPNVIRSEVSRPLNITPPIPTNANVIRPGTPHFSNNPSNNVTSQGLGGSISALPIFKQFGTVPPYHSEMTEAQFIQSLSRFMGLINLPLRKVPQFKDKPIQMHQLYRIVTTFGGFQKVTEGNRWNAVAASLQFSPVTAELLMQLRSFYFTLFYAYEQVFHHRIPLEKVSWPHAVIAHVKGQTPQPTFPFQPSQTPPQPQPQPQPSTTTSLPLPNDPSALLLGKEGSVAASGSSNSNMPSPAQHSLEAKGMPNDNSNNNTIAPVKRTLNSNPNPNPPTEPSTSNDPMIEPMAKRERNREEFLQDTLNATHQLTRKIMAIPVVGKVSYEEITLMLASGIFHVQSAALGILERLAFDVGTSLPSFTAMASILDALTELFTAEVISLAIKNVNGSKSSTGGFINKGGKEGMGRTNCSRPFEVLQRKAEAEVVDLHRIVRPNMNRIESIVNILRSWATRSEGPSIISQNSQLVWNLIVPSLTRSEIWIQLNLESYTGLWLIMLQVASYIQLTEITKFKSLLTVAIEELSFLINSQSRYAFMLHPAFILDTEDTEAVKKAIIHFIKISNQFWRQLPTHCFLLVDFLCRSTSNVQLGGVFDGDRPLRSGHALSETLVWGLEVLWEFVEHFAMSALGITFLIDKLLKAEDQQRSGEYRRYSESVLHNVNFGLPDGGYLELTLLTILHIIRRLDGSVYSGWANRVTPQLVSHCDSIRRLWFHPHPAEKTIEKSPILTLPFTASSSQPYLVLVRIYALLGHIAYNLELDKVGLREAELIIGWITTPPIGRVNQDLLCRPEFVQVAELFLSSIKINCEIIDK